MAQTPPRSACFRPDSYRDLSLFADREELLEDLVETLVAYLDPEGHGEGWVLLRGDRGVGKSMLARKAIHEVIHRVEVMRVEVDCAQTTHGQEAVLRQLARTLANEILQNANDATLRSEAELVRRFSDATKVKVRDVRQWSSSLKLGMNAGYKLFDGVQFEFGLSRLVGQSREVEETAERTVDARLLEELARNLLEDCTARGTKVLVFLDNLDQAGFAEVQDDVKHVTDLARVIFSLPRCLVVATMRTEFISADLAKGFSLELTVPPMAPEELLAVANKRMECAGDRRRKALEAAMFPETAATLSRFTGNAWGFLTWLAALDFERFLAAPGDAVALREVLVRVVGQQFPGLRTSELETLGAAYTKGYSYLSRNELASLGVNDWLMERAILYAAIVPDWLLSPLRYMLNPKLHFLAAIPPRAGQ
jgi:hypothetical protein